MPATLARLEETTAPAKCYGVAFETTLGWMALRCNDYQLQHVDFGYASFEAIVRALDKAQLDSAEDTPEWLRRLGEQLAAFASGDPQQFADVPISTEHLTPFAERVVDECRKVPWGHVLTYADLAKKAGRPGAARAVGNVMASNRLPLVVPCHRVVGSGGGLGGYSAPGGVATKRRLLRAEGSF